MSTIGCGWQRAQLDRGEGILGRLAIRVNLPCDGGDCAKMCLSVSPTFLGSLSFRVSVLIYSFFYCTLHIVVHPAAFCADTPPRYRRVPPTPHPGGSRRDFCRGSRGGARCAGGARTTFAPVAARGSVGAPADPLSRRSMARAVLSPVPRVNIDEARPTMDASCTWHYVNVKYPFWEDFPCHARRPEM